ncbi:DUF2271 domain-containing protein [Riemerella columbina]|uniref:DUF2271 domain-containing protein n=1 Tax=Riemerella columbina TaxID=103810 RepID=UPI00037BF8DA|nr:DUF2271 domain-containing protein [Riemerella columbina]
MKILKPLAIAGTLMLGATSFAQTSTYKCMLQLKNYKGEGSYVVVSLVDAKNNYIKTLAVMGDDDEWYDTITEWHKFQKEKKEKLDAITGASVPPGSRALKALKIDDKYLNKGYKIRFETAVEDEPYYPQDIEIPFKTNEVSKKYNGKGFIRFVKLNKV